MLKSRNMCYNGLMNNEPWLDCSSVVQEYPNKQQRGWMYEIYN